MACRFEVVLPGEDVRHLASARAALDEANRLEAQLTVFRDTSEISAINRLAAAAPVAVEPALMDLLCRCRDLHAATDGAFDITSTPLSRCWGFLKREGRLPSAEAIAAARATVGMDGVALDSEDRSVRFAQPGFELNLGAIGKGYALDRMADLLRARGVRDALLLAGGSSILAVGADRGGWPIDLRPRLVSGPSTPTGQTSLGAGPSTPTGQTPLGAGRLARVTLRDGAMATSGAGEQFVEVDGRRYGHVIDPRTGWPASGVLSATVITRNAADADAVSTALLIGGPRLAERYCAAHPGTLAVLALAESPSDVRTFGSFHGAKLSPVDI